MDTPLPSEGSRRVAFASQGRQFSGRSLDTSSIKSSIPSQKYARKASVFIFEHLSDMKHAGLGIGEKFNYWVYGKIRFLSKKWFTHCFLIIVMILYTVCGALIFLTVEGHNEKKLIDRDIHLQINELLNELRIKSLSVPDQFSDKEWLGEAARRLTKFEKIITTAFDRHPLVVSHTNGEVWNIWNAVVYCSTLYTTIGYGHIYPTTFTGRILTMAYSTIGIPLFLIALTDFGKLFTRGIKFVWAYIRRFYYTRSCRRVRRKSHIHEIIKGAQEMYEYATFRRMSVWGDPTQAKQDPNTQKRQSAVILESQNSDNPKPQTVVILEPQDMDAPKAQTAVILEPQTPAISNFEVDDEFNLPVSLALTMLVAYMLIGAAVFMVWENWEFFPAFYFVFISMSTIGFGDIVPEKPTYMILSIVYLCFGLALMSMCINVVQDKLSDTFTHASAKIGETIGIDVENNEEHEENGDETNGEENHEDNKEENLNKEVNANGLHVKESPFNWSTSQVVR